MPSKKRPSTAYTSDDGFVSDGQPASKKAKSSSNARKARDGKAPVDTTMQKDESGDPYWELSAGGTRRVTVNAFKGVQMVNVREYYEKDGQRLPGKKGISLPLDQFAALVDVLPQIEKILKEKGEDIPRPKYDEVKNRAAEEEAENKEAEDGEEDVEDTKNEKRNFEATSEEDEE